MPQPYRSRIIARRDRDARTKVGTLFAVKAYPSRHSLDRAVAAEVRAAIARTSGASITGAAAALGLRRATLSVRINGHVPFSPGELGSIACYLGTTASDLLLRAERELAATAHRASHPEPAVT